MVGYYKKDTKDEVYQYGTEIYDTEEEALKAYERIQYHNMEEAQYCLEHPQHTPQFIRRHIGYKNTPRYNAQNNTKLNKEAHWKNTEIV